MARNLASHLYEMVPFVGRDIGDQRVNAGELGGENGSGGDSEGDSVGDGVGDSVGDGVGDSGEHSGFDSGFGSRIGGGVERDVGDGEGSEAGFPPRVGRHRGNVAPQFGLTNENVDELRENVNMRELGGASPEEVRTAARRLDHRAAIMISGAAGMANINQIWVDCSPHRAWLDKMDERRMMKLAYEVADRYSEQMSRMGDALSGSSTLSEGSGSGGLAARASMQVFTTFRQEFIKHNVVCLSPSTEAAMNEISLMVSEFVVSKGENNDKLLPSTNNVAFDEDGVANPHDTAFPKIISRILRRHPHFNVRFCDVVGKLVAWKAALHGGTGFTRLRLVETRGAFIRTQRLFLEWMREAVQRDGLQKCVDTFSKTPWQNVLTCDWVSVALQMLEMEQSGQEASNPSRNKRARRHTSVYNL
jgi:hypothetical protein